jgi:hypothetical protein
MSELLRRLRIELKRSPKKSAILAFGLVVAVVFWGRLLWKPSKETTVEAENVSASTQVGVPGLPSSSSPLPLPHGTAPGIDGTRANGQSEPSWDDLLVWMRSTLDGNAAEKRHSVERDPFQASDPTLATATLEQEPEPGAETSEQNSEQNSESTEQALATTDPIRDAAANLSVQGILRVGSRRFVRLAGRTLGEGAAFELSGTSTEQGQPSVWVVVAIDAEGVVIRPSEEEGGPLRLSLEKPELSGVRVEAFGRE